MAAVSGRSPITKAGLSYTFTVSFGEHQTATMAVLKGLVYQSEKRLLHWPELVGLRSYFYPVRGCAYVHLSSNAALQAGNRYVRSTPQKRTLGVRRRKSS